MGLREERVVRVVKIYVCGSQNSPLFSYVQTFCRVHPLCSHDWRGGQCLVEKSRKRRHVKRPEASKGLFYKEFLTRVFCLRGLNSFIGRLT